MVKIEKKKLELIRCCLFWFLEFFKVQILMKIVEITCTSVVISDFYYFAFLYIFVLLNTAEISCIAERQKIIPLKNCKNKRYIRAIIYALRLTGIHKRPLLHFYNKPLNNNAAVLREI